MNTLEDQLNYAEPIEIPYADWQISNREDNEFIEAYFSTPASFLSIDEFIEGKGNCLLAALVVYLYRTSGKEHFVLNYEEVPLVQDTEKNNEPQVASRFPLTISVDSTQNFDNLVLSLLQQIENSRNRISHLFNTTKGETSSVADNIQDFKTITPITIKRVSSIEENQPSRYIETDLAIIIPDDGKQSCWLSLIGVLRKSGLEKMHEQFKILLEDIAQHRDQCIAKLEIIPQHEKFKLLEWNKTYKKYDHNLCLQDIFEAQVLRTPDKTAVIFEESQLSYQELNIRANQLAYFLRSLNVGPDTLVGVFMERSLEMVVSLYGIVKAGGAYVPLDPEYPSDRVSYMIEDAQVTVLLTQDHLLGKLPASAARIVCLDSQWGAISEQEVFNPRRNITPQNLAYLIYTSGSTGKPKGVMNEHCGICNRLFWMQDEYKLDHSDRVLQKTPFSFDVSVWEFFWPLMVGSSLIVAKPGGHKDGTYLVNLIREQAITTLHFVPPMLQLFVEEQHVHKCTSIKRVICSGEALPYELQKRFFSSLKAELHNLYGPTEAAVDVTYWACERESDEQIVPIGYPVANTQMYVLDSNKQPLPIGIPGELHIGGIQVARGYHNRPNLTAKTFIADPFSDNKEARLYKTGDLACYLPNGAIHYLGRIDNQVKIRGNRIELGEIEALLEQQNEIRQAIVIARADETGEKHLAAYIVLHSGEHINTSEMRAYLLKKIPDYMVPSYFMILDSLPLSPNGKVDRRRLPDPSNKRPDLTQAYVAPENPIELYLSRIWCEILKLDRIGINDKFFELGGTSLQAARVINRIQQNLHENIYIVSMFESPSIAEYANFLKQNYSQAIAEKIGLEDFADNQAKHGIRYLPGEDKVDEKVVELMRKCIVPLSSESSNESASDNNKRAIFILAPPRSGTTLLRIMLAGHPDIFSATELQLLGFHNLQDRRSAYSGKFSLWLEGTIRTIMEIKDCDVEEATRIMTDFETRGYTTKQFYHTLQDWIGNRILADKSPSYVLDLKTLEKAEHDFEDPLYIHLVRHPYAMVRSFVNYHIEQVLFLKDHSFPPKQLAELVWLISHQNTLQFLKRVPGHRQHQILYEDLVKTPKAIMKNMCDHFNLQYVPELISPYKNIDSKMTDGIHKDSKPMGDTNIFNFKEIDPKAADSWKGVMHDDFLSDITWEIAESLSYERPASSVTIKDDKEPHAMRKQSIKTRKTNLQRNRNRRKQQPNRNTGN